LTADLCGPEPVPNFFNTAGGLASAIWPNFNKAKQSGLYGPEGIGICSDTAFTRKDTAAAPVDVALCSDRDGRHYAATRFFGNDRGLRKVKEIECVIVNELM
jgi:hypothetical protein